MASYLVESQEGTCMNGAESLVRTLLACGVDTVFANPGTSEMHFVAALDRFPALRCVPALAEGVVTGAADGYARMAGKPAATLLHCGPGLMNGLANLHNARRARTPVVNLIGDQATHHRPLDAPLTADTEALARTVSAWVRTSTAAHEVGADAATAVAAARSAPGAIASLILPSDTCWNEGGAVAAPRSIVTPATVADETVEAIARLVERNEPTLLLVGGRVLSAAGHAGRIGALPNCRLLAPMSNARVARGRDAPAIDRVPYGVEAAIQRLAGVRHVVLVEAEPPVTFFAYPGKPGTQLPPDASLHVLARPDEDGPDALQRLSRRLGAPLPALVPRTRPPPAVGAITPETLAQSLAALLPQDAVVVDEGVTVGRSMYSALASAAPHDWLQLCGGAIGEGIPMATGAALGAPGRRVVGLQADGSALYTLQGLWTQARQNLDVTTVIFSNRRYAILQGELAAVGATGGPATTAMFELQRPDLDWVRLAAGFGVEAARADTMERFNDLFAAAHARRGPFLIEACL
jgi:acetolactate synthase-1/2/3 large subunit